MTHLIELLTAIVLCGTILGGCVRGVSKLTRIADSVDRLGESMQHVVGQIGDHEKRLDRLERTSDADHEPKVRTRSG